MVGQVLVEAKPKVKRAAPYIPVYYQVIPSVACPKACEVCQAAKYCYHYSKLKQYNYILFQCFSLWSCRIS